MITQARAGRLRAAPALLGGHLPHDMKLTVGQVQGWLDVP
jgi:hypothetical protein